MKLSNEKLQSIITLLRDTDLTQRAIAEKVGVVEGTVSNVNLGKTNYQIDVEYPIRDYSSPTEEVMSYRDMRAEQIQEELYRDELSFKQIADKYGVHVSTITRINLGQRSRDDEKYDYPISRNLTERQKLIVQDYEYGISFKRLKKDWNLSTARLNKILKKAGYKI